MPSLFLRRRAKKTVDNGRRPCYDKSCVERQTIRASGGIGRLAGFRCQCSQGRAGSTPASRTRQAPASKRSWGLLFARNPWGATVEETASLPCLFLIFYINAQKKARKYHIQQGDITREVTQYAGLPPRFRLNPSGCRNRYQSLDPLSAACLTSYGYTPGA